VKHDGMDRTTARALALALATVIGAGLMPISAAADSAAGSDPGARTSRSLNGTATAHLHLLKPEGSRLIEVGPVSGALVGSARAELSTGAIFKGSFTIHTRVGSITGHGQASPHGSGRYQSFSGWFLATGGSGRYAHIKGRGGLYGVFDRRNDSVVIQTTGRFTY
jgi:hypothetical protein